MHIAGALERDTFSWIGGRALGRTDVAGRAEGSAALGADGALEDATAWEPVRIGATDLGLLRSDFALAWGSFVGSSLADDGVGLSPAAVDLVSPGARLDVGRFGGTEPGGRDGAEPGGRDGPVDGVLGMSAALCNAFVLVYCCSSEGLLGCVLPGLPVRCIADLVGEDNGKGKDLGAWGWTWGYLYCCRSLLYVALLDGIHAWLVTFRL